MVVPLVVLGREVLPPYAMPTVPTLPIDDP
jgi:hypothetical protein